MPEASCPKLYEINTRVWLREIGSALGRPATLDDVSDAELDHLASQGFGWIWLLGVWQTGETGRMVSATYAGWRNSFAEALHDLKDEDICGSCFAITGYAVHRTLGGDAALIRLRERMNRRGLRLMLDFVSNHTAIDHPWVSQRPELYVQGTAGDLTRAPEDFVRVLTERGPLILAHGRDPGFPVWPDVAQLNYGEPATGLAMTDELLAIAKLCDGVRCDMAMLVLPDIFRASWGIVTGPFWSKAIRRIRASYPDFLFLAEVYWQLERELLREGFDYVYDKGLYDRLRSQTARPVREYLRAASVDQRRLVRFLENHDEKRAAEAFPWDVHQAAAVLCYLAPGLRLFHQRQFEGRRKQLPVHLSRADAEPVNAAVSAFYDQLMSLLRKPVFQDGDWQCLDPDEAWPGNGSWNGFIGFQWTDRCGTVWIVAVNYQPCQGQCYLRCPGMACGPVILTDQMGAASYEREGGDLASRGLFLDMPGWSYHVFELTQPLSEPVGAG